MADTFADSGLDIMGVVDAHEYIQVLNNSGSNRINFKVPTLDGAFVVPFEFSDLNDVPLVLGESQGNAQIGQQCAANLDFTDSFVVELNVNPNSIITGYYKGHEDTLVSKSATTLFTDESVALGFLKACERVDSAAFVLPANFSFSGDDNFLNIVRPEFAEANSYSPDWIASNSQVSLIRSSSYVGESMIETVRSVFSRGHKHGIAKGRDMGYSDGLDVGRQSGYEEGLTAGRQAGYEEGFAAGAAKQLSDDKALLKDVPQATAVKFLSGNLGQVLPSGQSNPLPEVGSVENELLNQSSAQAQNPAVQTQSVSNQSVQQPNVPVSQSVETTSSQQTVVGDKPTKRQRHTDKADKQDTRLVQSWRGPKYVAAGQRVDIPIILSPASSVAMRKQRETYFDVTIPIADGKPGKPPTRYFFELRESYLKSAGVDTSVMGPTVMSVNPNDQLVGGTLVGNRSWINDKKFIPAGTVAQAASIYQTSHGNQATATPDDLSDLLDGATASPVTPSSNQASHPSDNDTPGGF